MFHLDPRSFAVALATAALATTLATLPAQSTGIRLNNAVDGFVEVPYSPEVVPQGGITVEAWVTYDDATIPASWSYPTVVRQNRNAGQESFFLRVNANNNQARVLRWLVNANSIVRVDWTFGAGQLLTWTHVAGTWDGTTARLFVNGAEVASATGSGPLRDQGDVLRIGKGSDVATPIEVWNGDIDEVRIWPFARTAAEIQSTMNTELAMIPGEVSTWNFNNSAQDSSSGRDGTLGGAVSYVTGAPITSSQLFPGTTLGASTQGCLGAIHIAPTAIPQVGNLGFALVAHRVGAGNPTICAFSTTLAGAPTAIAGIDLWVDVGTLIGGFGVGVDALGTARVDLPIAASLPTGLQLAAQFVTIDACGPQGVTASDAILFQTTP